MEHERVSASQLGNPPSQIIIRGRLAQVRSELSTHFQNAIEEHRYRRYLIPFNQREGIQTESQLTEWLHFSKVPTNRSLLRMRSDNTAVQLIRLEQWPRLRRSNASIAASRSLWTSISTAAWSHCLTTPKRAATTLT